ncbi:polysaccharide deacetylase family protein [Frankia sp. AgB32]|uniref:polysaccharide deacetylase family protein n=1 Tax=Frankia sp. AgB32 TaxID=631119 RepID=UPI00200EBF5A|nr:polysaccharide deacetylase family protein [Frankia sp. AgB32]MCK9898363.1 polysaccharide deacetylase family protein [Frankia sp. AgB32]
MTGPARSIAPRATVAGVIAVGVTAIAHAAPAITSLPAPRNRLTPGLAGVGDPGHVALTFDDGPDPASTPQFLDLLAARGVRATFFLLGSMLAESPELGRELVAAGHEVAVHGWEHRYLVLRGPRATHDDLARGRDLVGEVAGRAPTYFRPPYGVLSTAALRSARCLGLRPVLWTAWGKDWSARATAGSVFRTVRRDLAGGGTVLLHDSDCTSAPNSWRSALGALPALLDECAERGLRVGPLREHFAEPATSAGLAWGIGEGPARTR